MGENIRLSTNSVWTELQLHMVYKNQIISIAISWLQA